MAKKLPIEKGEKNKILRRKSVELATEKITSSEIKELIGDIIKTMKEEKGVGLAAPQIGENIRLFCVDTKEKPLIFINPRITKKSLGKEIADEGCLSLPGVWGPVKRSKSVEVSFYNEQGIKIKIKASGLLARVIQHEYDHLDGILFIDRLKK
ncbi:MAG: peptide deformylase [Patescibacteria group bacterium]|nr:peptide deformylase [Patescibacteria group bacterium]MDD5490482.1 peptide deformylase [Patescibacteria group bacterium]